MKRLNELTLEEAKELYKNNREFSVAVDESIEEDKNLYIEDILNNPTLEEYVRVKQWGASAWSLVFTEDDGDSNRIHLSEQDYIDDADVFMERMLDDEDLKNYLDDEAKEDLEKGENALGNWKSSGRFIYGYEKDEDSFDDSVTEEYLNLCRACRKMVLDIDRILHEEEELDIIDVEMYLNDIIHNDNYMGDFETDGALVYETTTTILR